MVVTLMALRQGSVAGALGMHAAWNWSSGQLFGLNISNASFGKESIFRFEEVGGVMTSGGSGGPEWSIATLVVLSFYLIWLVRDVHRNGVYRSPDKRQTD